MFTPQQMTLGSSGSNGGLSALTSGGSRDLERSVVPGPLAGTSVGSYSRIREEGVCSSMREPRQLSLAHARTPYRNILRLSPKG